MAEEMDTGHRLQVDLLSSLGCLQVKALRDCYSKWRVQIELEKTSVSWTRLGWHPAHRTGKRASWDPLQRLLCLPRLFILLVVLIMLTYNSYFYELIPILILESYSLTTQYSSGISF